MDEETNQAETVSESHDVPAVLRPLDGAAWGGAARGRSGQVGCPPQVPRPPHLSRAGREQAAEAPQGKQLAGTHCSNYPPTAFLASSSASSSSSGRALLWDVPGEPHPIILPCQGPVFSVLSGPGPWGQGVCGLLRQGCAPRNPFLTQRAADPRRNHQAGARQPEVPFLSTAFSQRPRTAPCHGRSFPPQIQNLPSGMGQWSMDLKLTRGRRICILPGLEVRHQRDESFRVVFQETTSSRAFLCRDLAHLTTVRDPEGQDLGLKELGMRKGTVFGASGWGAAGFRPRAFSILWRRLLTEFNSNPTPQRRGGFGPHSQLVSLLMVLR